MDNYTRLKHIKDLDAYITEKNYLLLDVINNVGWTEKTLDDEVKVQCPIDSSHWVHESSLPQHVEMCSWVKDGYLKEEKDKQPPSSKGFYQHVSSITSVTVDKETQAKILIEKGLMQKNYLDEIPDLPKTMDRFNLEMTADQRLAVYDYVVEKAKSSSKPKNVTLEDLMFDFEKKTDEDGKPKTDIEILAEQRDYKRRRQSYRAKNVHITQKSYTEVMKEVIENQNTYLAETRKHNDDDGFEETLNIEDPKCIKDVSLEREEERDSNRHRNSTKDRELHQDDENSEYDLGHHHRHSRKDRSSPSKKRKHKHKRSRSRSRSRHHKKSHKHKHKKSRNS